MGRRAPPLLLIFFRADEDDVGLEDEDDSGGAAVIDISGTVVVVGAGYVVSDIVVNSRVGPAAVPFCLVMSQQYLCKNDWTLCINFSEMS